LEVYDHLPLPEYKGNLQRRKRQGGGGYRFPENRQKAEYYKKTVSKANEIAKSFKEIKTKFKGKLNPHLIYRIKVNQSVDYKTFEQTLHSLGGLTVLSVAEDKKGYWVVFSNDEELQVFKNKLAQYSGIKEGKKYDFFNAIDGIDDIPKEEKIGELIKKEPPKPGEVNYFNVELWRMEDEDLFKFISQLKDTYDDLRKFRITDQLITRSFALLRVKMTTEIFEELLELKEIARIDRPFYPSFRPYEYNQIDISDFEVLPPDDDAVGILIIDSGITSNHPLLEKAVGGEENFQEVEKETQDVAGHGTAVAGVAIYGNIEKCIAEREFAASNWLFSAKVMYGEKDLRGNILAVYDEEKLLESQIYDAIRTFLDNPEYKIKAVNLSFGNVSDILKEENNRQFPLAALIDELAQEYSDVVFIVSAGNQHPGNFYELEQIVENYPHYLVENADFRIINPATSALSLTVGSIASEARYFDPSLGGTEENMWVPIAKEHEPSPFTRTGFGINGMIKPELVHFGGNLILRNNHGYLMENLGGKLALLSNDPTEKLFAFDYGTSFAAPQITHLVGLIANQFPHKSANFIKNLLLQSAEIPLLPSFKGNQNQKLKSTWRVLGYGFPDYEKAIHSFDNRIVLLDEGEIGLDEIKVFTVNLPKTFFETKGSKRISVVLTFNPPTRATRGDSYLGNRMEFKLFHSVHPDEIVEKYAEINLAEVGDETTPAALKKYEIELVPGANIRKAGCHQKGWKEYKREPRNLPNSPLTLVLINSNKWISDERYKQPYCVSLIVEHSEKVQLYDMIRTEVQQRVRIR
jgi:hypothetical protein